MRLLIEPSFVVNGIIQYAGLYVYWKCSISRFLSFSLRSSLSFYPDCILLSFRDISDIRFNFAFSLRRKNFGKTSITNSIWLMFIQLKEHLPRNAQSQLSTYYTFNLNGSTVNTEHSSIKPSTCIAFFLSLEFILHFKRSAKDLISVGNHILNFLSF